LALFGLVEILARTAIALWIGHRIAYAFPKFAQGAGHTSGAAVPL
jgi:hypothetical protein